MFEDDSKLIKLRQARSVDKEMITFFFSKTGPVCTIPLEQQKAVNAEWYTIISLPSIRKTDSAPVTALAAGSRGRAVYGQT
ncbi:hypothetical protein EVAR_34304_1 [Eumeta japonica]|uniref:Uncharacterized protein n=1 Tax=Eumeta variegata TaxID=151549 RepID=A0A4C1VCI5_EUMVA|nr:hypothetical protein EVAR_34304_1 [Eumeta japonica]